MALVVGVTLTVCMYLVADLSPRVTVEAVNFAKEQKSQTRFMGFISERRRYLAALPLESYIQKIVSGKKLPESAKSAAFAARADAVLRNTGGGDPWRKSLGPGPRLWFKLRAPPVKNLSGRLASDPRRSLYLPYETGGKLRYLRFSLHTFQLSDFAIGTGYRGFTPPNRLFYPLRGWAWLPALLGLLFYLWIPQPPRDEATVTVSRVSAVTGDILAILFFGFFFSLPFFICGSVQAVSRWGPLALFLWPFALAGLYMLKVNTRYAAFVARFVPGGIYLRSLSLDEVIRYDEIEAVTPAVLKNPRWLGVLSGVAALFSRGADQARMAGQTLLTSSASYGGLHFRLKDGRVFFLWAEDQRGNLIFKGLDRLLDELKAAGVWKDVTPVEKRGFGTGVVTGSSRKGGKSARPPRRVRPMLRYCLAPLLIVAAFILLDRVATARDGALLLRPVTGEKNVEVKPPRPGPNLPPLKKSEVAWRRTLDGRGDTLGKYIVRAGDGDFLVAGMSYRGRSDILLLRADGQGRVLWRKTYGGAGDERPAGIAAAGEGTFVVAGTRGPALFHDVYLLKVDEAGKILWEKTWGNTNADEQAVGMALEKDGTLAVVVDIGYRPTLVFFSRKGRFLSRRRITTGLIGEKRLFVGNILALPDGALVICGVVKREGPGFQDAFLMKLTPRGARVWCKTYGGEGKQVARAVHAMPDGGFLLTGSKGFFNENTQRAWLVRTGPKGVQVWEKTFESPGNAGGDAAVTLHSGGAVILGFLTLPRASADDTLTGINAEGDILWERRIERNTGVSDLVAAGEGDIVLTGSTSKKDRGGLDRKLMIMKIHVNSE